MDQDFDRMIREGLREAVDTMLKNHPLAALKLPQETARQRVQRKLGEWLIITGMRLCDDSLYAAHPAKWSHERI